MLFKKKSTLILDYGGHHYFMCRVTLHSASVTSNGCTQLATDVTAHCILGSRRHVLGNANQPSGY